MTKIVTRQSRQTGPGGAFIIAALLMAVVGFYKWGPRFARIQDSQQEREWENRRIPITPPLTAELKETLDKSGKTSLDNLNRYLEERRQAREAEESKPAETPAPSVP
jgi:hypothetical protein